jgi:PAS domain S-box-containing protein
MGRYQRRAGYIVAVVATLLVLVARLALERVLADQARLLPFILAVMAAAWWGGLRPGLLATFLAAFVGILYVVPPNNSLNIERVADGLNAALFIIVGVTISFLFEELHTTRHNEVEKQFRTLADSVAQLVWMGHPDGRRFWFNQRWYDYTGTTLDEVEGHGWQALCDPADLPHVLQTWDAALAAGAPWEATYRLRGKDGCTRWFLARGVPIHNGAGPGVLQPGERIRVPIYYAGLEQPWDLDEVLELELRVHAAGDTTTIDWPSLENELRPNSIAAEVWPAVLANLQSQIGATWGDYVRMLNNNALYLSRLGVPVSSVEQLYGFELQQVIGIGPLGTVFAAEDAHAESPRLPLTFSRPFGNTITERYRVGPLGRGWNTSWQQFGETLTDGTIIVHESADAQRRFQPDIRRENTFFSQTSDTGTLRKLTGGAYELTESSGLVTRFLPDGRLELVRDAYGNKITAAYTNNRLTSLTHSSGKSLAITYNAAGRIASVTDPFGRATTFSYDATNSLLLTATGPAGTDTYTYSIGNGAAREYALTSVTDPSGVTQSLEYDARGRLTATFIGANVGRTSYAYDETAGVTITDAANVFTTIFYDHNRQVARVEDNTGNYARTQYDTNLRPVIEADAQGATRSTTWTITGAVRTLTDELDHTTTFTPGGPLNHPLAFSDARGNSTRYAYNTTGDVTATTYTDNSVERATYDVQGNLDVLTNRRGQTIDQTVNASGQATRHYALGWNERGLHL